MFFPEDWRKTRGITVRRIDLPATEAAEFLQRYFAANPYFAVRVDSCGFLVAITREEDVLDFPLLSLTHGNLDLLYRVLEKIGVSVSAIARLNTREVFHAMAPGASCKA